MLPLLMNVDAHLHKFLLCCIRLTGRQVQLRHVRGDKELPALVDDPNYDVQYQEYRQFQKPINVLPVSGRPYLPASHYFRGFFSVADRHNVR